MSFMHLATYTGPYIVVDTAEGVFYVPESDYQADDFEPDNVYDVAEATGTLACLDSACLDHTEWFPVESEATAAREHCEMFGCYPGSDYAGPDEDSDTCSVCGDSL